MRPNSTLQDSGIEWIGAVPSYWRICLLKHAIKRFVAGGTPSTGEDLFWAESGNGTPWVAISDMSNRDNVLSTAKCLTVKGLKDRRLSALPAGTVLYSMYASIGYAAILDIPAVTNQAILGLVIDDGVNAKFLRGYLNALRPHVLQEAASNTQDNLNAQKVQNVPLVLPPLHEQIAIASYLDVEAARIDALIDEKCKLIELLREQSVMVAESVIAPAHDGRQAKLGYFVNLLPGYAFPSESFSADESDVPLLRGVNVAPSTIRWEDNMYWPADQCNELDRFRLIVGDVVFGMDRPWIASGARVAVVDAVSEGALLLQRVCRIRGGDHISNRFVYYVLRSDRFRQSIEFELTGVSVPHISPEQITRFKIPVLTVNDQEQRCNDADDEISRIDGLIEVAERMIDALKELRSATITDAVLGRIDVRSHTQVETQELEPA